ncbi:MAG: HlyD family secretion protein [Novosphingobium sp.]|nr:HlyD family secretion protein [Novosphingobium sp.]
MTTRLRRMGIVLLVALLAGAIAFYFYYDRHLQYFQETNDARIEADQVTIGSKLAGYVQAVLVDDNQSVAKGARLVEIDPLDFRTQLAASDAGIATASAAEDAARAAQAEGIAGVALARAALRAARASLSLAERELNRYRPLVAAGAEPKMKLSQLVADKDRAVADVAARQAALSQAHKRVASLAAQTRNLGAQIAAARVQRQASANDLASASIVSPIAGRVANRSVRVGQYVQPGQRLMTVVPDEGLYVVANFKETQVGLMRSGQPAKIVVDALPGVEFRGVVASVTPGTGANFSLIKPENATGNFTKIVQRVPVRIKIEAGPASKRVLVPGLSLEVEVDTRASRDEIEEIRDEQEKSAK